MTSKEIEEILAVNKQVDFERINAKLRNGIVVRYDMG